MKYIYDIILNFNEKFYDFYEWQEKDNIEYIKRIPIFKVTNSVIADLKNSNVVLSSEFLKTINNKSEIYTNTGIGIIEFACLFCTDDMVLAIEFNEKGVSIFRSDLLIDESMDIIEYSKKMKVSEIDYKVISELSNQLMTRKEINMINFIKKELFSIKKNSNDKLKYIYYECFNKNENNINKIIFDLEKYINNSPKKIFDLLMLGYSKGLQK